EELRTTRWPRSSKYFRKPLRIWSAVFTPTAPPSLVRLFRRGLRLGGLEPVEGVLPARPQSLEPGQDKGSRETPPQQEGPQAAQALPGFFCLRGLPMAARQRVQDRRLRNLPEGFPNAGVGGRRRDPLPAQGLAQAMAAQPVVLEAAACEAGGEACVVERPLAPEAHDRVLDVVCGVTLCAQREPQLLLGVVAPREPAQGVLP